MDPLSTTMVSKVTARWAPTLDKHVSRCCRPFHETMTTDTSGCTRDLAIDPERDLRRALPGERRRAREPARTQVVAQRLVVHDADDGVAPRRYIARIEQQSCPANHLGDRSGM